MSKFKTIEKLGLKVFGMDVIKAEDLESLLQSAQVVYEVENSAGINSWLHIEAIGAKSKAILIGITPVKKKTKAEVALEFVDSLAKDATKFWNVSTLEEAKKISEMKG